MKGRGKMGKKIEWAPSDAVVCNRCGKPLTVPFAHLHFHYGTEGLSDAAKAQIQELVGPGHGDAVGELGKEMCMGCFRELIQLISDWLSD